MPDLECEDHHLDRSKAATWRLSETRNGIGTSFAAATLSSKAGHITTTPGAQGCSVPGSSRYDWNPWGVTIRSFLTRL